jgi:hypothetical protein
MSLQNAIQTRAVGQDTLPDELNAVVPALISRFNSEVSPRLLSRLPTEELPTSPRAASSFRARVSLLVEYSLIEMLADFLNDDATGVHATFNTTNQFADFFVRDDDWEIELRIDIKTLHDLSAEASARFDLPISMIREKDDYLLYAAWQWRDVDYRGVTVTIPAILDAVFIPAREIALERDLRQILSGGSFDATGMPLAASGLGDTNFGKINRIVHAPRRNASDLSPRVRKLLQLMEVEEIARTEVPPSMEDVEALADVVDSAGVVTDSIDDA